MSGKTKTARGVNLAQLREAEAKKKAEKNGSVAVVEPPAPYTPKKVKDELPPPPPLPEKLKEVVDALMPAAEKEEKPPVPPKAEKPAVEEKPERPADFTGVICAPPSEERGEGIGRGTKYRALVFGHPVTGILRWMWKEGFQRVEIEKAMNDLLEIPPQKTTYGLQKSQLNRGGKGSKTPELTEEQAEKLRSYKMV